MKVEKKSGSKERTILIAMIVNAQVLGEISLRWEEKGMFNSKWANIVAGWCVKYFRKYRKSPKRAIENLYESWAEQGDKDTILLVEKFLSSISGQYAKMNRRINSSYVLDIASNHFNIVKLTKLSDRIQGHIDLGEIDEARKIVADFQYVRAGLTKPVDLFDRTSIISVSQSDEKSTLITYPGALGRFYGNSLEREAFIAFMGPEKRGISFHLLDLAWRGTLQRKRVAYFEAGDNSENQLKRRFYTRIIGRPLRATRKDRPVICPKTLEIEDDKPVVKSKGAIHYTDPVTSKEIWAAMKVVRDEKIKSDKSYLRLSCHPNSSLSVSGIWSMLREWEMRKWVPDVVVIDYADILAPPPGFRGEGRDAINENWKALRRLSQELHCLVVTATQANAASYTVGTLGMQNFSEDKRKFAHVTGMVGLNQGDEEKEKGIMRLNWLVLREEEFVSSRHVYVAGCLAIANPCMKSAN